MLAKCVEFRGASHGHTPENANNNLEHAGKKKENTPLPPINKFIEYPFFKENKILIFEICKFFDQLIKDKIYIRLEKIFK